MNNFLVHNGSNRAEMLNFLGIENIEELFDVIPNSAKMGELSLEKPLDELAVQKKISKLSNENNTNFLNFLGGGSYKRFIPAAVSAVSSRFEFLSAYTPYQPEISQGTLQVMYEFQSMICNITGADVSNASVYDGASACAEAILMAVRLTKINKVWVDIKINPNYLEVIKTYLWAGEIELEIGEKPPVGTEFAAKLFQFPNYYGEIEASPLKTGKELIIACVDLTALALLEPPNFDIVVGDFGSLGIPTNFGGPYGGFIACKDAYKRQLAGRIVGKTIDKEGNAAYCLTLSAREQHIRREKATSNICSNQAHSALCATLYLSLIGKDGFLNIANISQKNAHILADGLVEKGFKILNKNFFSEFTLQLPNGICADNFLLRMHQNNILAGIKIDDNKILVSTTEILDEDELQKYINLA